MKSARDVIYRVGIAFRDDSLRVLSHDATGPRQHGLRHLPNRARGSRSQGSQRNSEGCIDFLREGTRPSPPLICHFIDQMRAQKYRVEWICRVLTAQRMQVAPLTYRNWKTAPPSARVVADAHYCAPTTLQKAVDSAEGLYGRRKMTAHLRRSGHQVAACTVDRLMRDEGLAASSAAAGTAPPSRVERTVAGPRTCSIETSPPRRRTVSGPPTSPTGGPGRDSCTWRS